MGDFSAPEMMLYNIIEIRGHIKGIQHTMRYIYIWISDNNLMSQGHWNDGEIGLGIEKMWLNSLGGW